ncbi:MAG: hypothetical protein SGI87_05150 [Flavobacteriales bacterium]|nr:hypothetical protein [Flavobacteriales bacterium]
MEVFFGSCAAASCKHEMANAIKVAVIDQWSETELDYDRYINPNQAIEKLHPTFADECSIIWLRFKNPARILQKLPSCVMRDKRYKSTIIKSVSKFRRRRGEWLCGT